MSEESGSSHAPDADGAPPSFRATDHAEGQLIADKYRLVRRLGEGGMASVWLAHNEALDIEVAIKFIRADLQHPGLTSRLLQEARAAAKLGHPAIVRVSDYGKTETQQPYIVMELLTGEDLAKQIAERGPMPPIRAVRMLLPIAHALAAAHAKGIVHRDLKPDNIFVHQREGGGVQPKLVDFGIAKLKREDDQRITQIGSAMGSPAYMCPEQARGLDVDARADVWAFSIVLYETLTGKLPFEGHTYSALLCAILEAQPKPITELGVPEPQLWALIARGLEKDPAKRWETMRDMGVALAHWLQGRGIADDVTGGSLIATWIDPQSDSERPMLHSLSGADDLRPSFVQSGMGDRGTQLSFHDGVATQPRRKSLTSLAAIGAGIGGVLLIGGVVIFLATRPRPSAEPPAAAATSQAAETLPLEQMETPVPPIEKSAAAAKPAVEPTAADQDEEPPAKSAAPIAKKAPRTTGKAPATKTSSPGKAAAETPKPTPATKPKPKPSEELDIKTNL